MKIRFLKWSASFLVYIILFAAAISTLYIHFDNGLINILIVFFLGGLNYKFMNVFDKPIDKIGSE